MSVRERWWSSIKKERTGGSADRRGFLDDEGSDEPCVARLEDDCVA